MNTSRTRSLAAAFALFAVASAAGCKDSTAPSAVDKLAVTANTAGQVLTITNNSNERLYYWYFVDDGLTDWSRCGGNPCGSVEAKSSVTVPYAEIQNAGLPNTFYFFYWRQPTSTWSRFDFQDRELRLSLR